jgi:demethylmenaquinone methyltransferase/2-methoxy-6-polyprenyl-1,4-benzoquinol methylase
MSQSQRPRIELTGFEARHYDLLLNGLTLGYYPFLLRRVYRDLEIQPGERILDFGAGTGRMALAMARRAGPAGRVTGLEIGPEMQAQFRRRAARQPNLGLLGKRIEEPLGLEEPGDRVLLSFVLHGFGQHQRILIIQNAWENLQPEGQLCILDWNEFDLAAKPRWFQALFRRVECEAAQDFIARDWTAILADYRFAGFQTREYFRGHFRLIRCRKI